MHLSNKQGKIDEKFAVHSLENFTYVIILVSCRPVLYSKKIRHTDGISSKFLCKT